MRINTILIFLCFIATFFAWFANVPEGALAYSYDNLTVHHAWWTPVTAIFVHGNLLHLLGNVLFMVLFGYPLEKILGASKFSAAFMLGGILSFLLSSFFYPAGEYIVGASGAISTVIAMMMLYNPWKLSFILVRFPMPLGVAGLTFVLLNFWMANRPMDNTTSMHVAYSVHITGFALGILFSMLLNPDWKKNLLACILLFIGYYAVAYWLINLLTKH